MNYLADKNKVLDVVNVSVAGMRDGIGPLLTIFLIQKTRLDPQQLSFLLAAPSLINILAQVPVGVWLDRVHHQGRIVALGAAFMALASFGISTVPPFVWMFGIQLLAGLACCLVSVGVPAVSLSVVSANGFGARIARNEIFSKVGNFGALALTGYLTQKYSIHAMFYVVYAFAASLIISSFSLKKPLSPTQTDTAIEIDSATHLNKGFDRSEFVKELAIVEAACASTPVVWRDKYFRKLVAAAFVLQFSNASLFLIFEQSFVRKQVNGGVGILSAALFATQVVIILASLAIARWTKKVEPINILRVAFVLIAIRSAVLAAQQGLVSLMVAQFFDGCIAAILIIVPARALASANSGNFNVLSGILGTCVAMGAMASTLSAGYLIAHFGFVCAFLAFGAFALLGLLLSLVCELEPTNKLKRPHSTTSKNDVDSLNVDV